LAILIVMLHFLRVPESSAGSGNGRKHKMRDEMDMRLWEAHHSDFSAFLAEALGKVRVSFERLVAIEFDAPWRGSSAGNR
jgi:hypothetical protein